MTYTVLTIEDQADIRRLIRMTLEFQDINVLEASNGPDGLQLARSARPDLILLDMMMPGMNGLAVGRELQADAALSQVPVVMLSAMGAPHDFQAGKASGVADYLVKPFSPRHLLDVVGRLIEDSRQAGTTSVTNPGD